MFRRGKGRVVEMVYCIFLVDWNEGAKELSKR